MGHRVVENITYQRRRRIRPRKRLRALLCRPGPDEVTDSCLMMLSREADIEQVPTLAEAMKRCLDGRADILFVNMFSSSSRELTALSAFRTLTPSLWIVALAPEDMKPSLIAMGIADEVLTAATTLNLSQPRA